MIEYMTKNKYNNYIQLCKNFEQSLIDCVQEISQITNDRELIGIYNEDSDLYEGRYLVHTYRIITDERTEYERLKLKFGD